MATVIWQGGASAVQQEWSLTPGGTIEADDVFNVILTNEAGGTQTEAVVAGGTTVAAVCDAIVAQCNSSSQTLFQALTFTDNTTSVSVTANVAGVPFYLSETTTETGGGAADAQTFVAAEVTANAGPLDYNTTSNWVGGSLPAANDTVIFAPRESNNVSYDVRYGLDQSSVDVGRVRVSPEYTGTIGDIDNGYYLRIDISGTGGSVNNPSLVVNGGHSVWVKGSIDNIYADGSVGGGENALRLDDAGSGDLYITSGFRGTIRYADSSTIGNVHNGYAPNVRLIIGSSVSNSATVTWLAGYMESKSAIGTYRISGGTVVHEDGAVSSALQLYGGTVFYNSDGTIADFDQWGGRMDLSRNHNSTLTISTAVVNGGVFHESGGTVDVTYPGGLVINGGDYKAQSNPTITTSK